MKREQQILSEITALNERIKNLRKLLDLRGVASRLESELMHGTSGKETTRIVSEVVCRRYKLDLARLVSAGRPKTEMSDPEKNVSNDPKAKPGSLHRMVLPCDVAALFCRSDSVYKTIAGVDVWDKSRNALLWPGGRPVIAHPPCRAWGRLAHFAKPEEGEKDLALWAVEQVRRWGGVLEHPQCSRLWKVKELPRPGRGRDEWGGFSVSVDQHWWGHRANKETWLYICGLSEKLPAFPIRLDEGTHRIKYDARRGTASRNWWKKRLPTRERESTPEAFAKWLVQVAMLCSAWQNGNGNGSAEVKV